MTRAMVDVARAIDEAGLTKYGAAKRANTDGAVLLRVILRGQPAGLATIEKLREAFGTDANLWLEEASGEEREAWQRHVASIRKRGEDAVQGRATP